MYLNLHYSTTSLVLIYKSSNLLANKLIDFCWESKCQSIEAGPSPSTLARAAGGHREAGLQRRIRNARGA